MAMDLSLTLFETVLPSGYFDLRGMEDKWAPCDSHNWEWL